MPSRMNRKGVFLDLNGTLVMPLKPERLTEHAEVPGAANAVARLSAAGFVCPVVTVQSRIAKGLFSSAEFETWFAGFAADFRSRGAVVVGPYVCPHRFREPCACKKPSSLLYERAAAEHGILIRRSFVIGDSPDDMRAARRLGARGCLVQTGWAADRRVVDAAAPETDVLVTSIVEAVDWILTTSTATV